ncbi:response regulator [Hydrogenophaga sp.]|uniref:response regulator n=1 Tax=Hydrogenophaga sp. TaxID=1904254 RepID=UPI003F6FB3F2
MPAASLLPDPGSTPGSGLCMLIADDDRDSAESLVLLMELHGHTVHLAHDGEEALAVAQRIRPQVSILDIGMPQLDGHSVARRIRESLPGMPMLIVALTGRELPEDRQRSAEAGFDHHFIKPLILSELHRYIQRWRDGDGAGLPPKG